MAIKKPLVMGSDGLIQQLQPGDSVSVPTTINIMTNGEVATPIVIGAPVYMYGANSVRRAQANAAATAKVIGLGYDASISAAATGAIATGGALTATTTQWDAVVTGGSGGLVYNTFYYLDPSNAGKLTTTPPSSVGQLIVLVGIGISTTEMKLLLIVGPDPGLTVEAYFASLPTSLPASPGKLWWNGGTLSRS